MKANPNCRPSPQNEQTLEQLTENIIKKVALRFFRNYYKFRLRYEDQPVTAKYDLEGVGGIIADGYYSFKKTDGKPFTATFEATSKESKDEVIYKSEPKVLFWDGLAVASLAMVVLAGLNLHYEFHPLDNTRLPERAGLFILGMAVSFAIFYLIAKNFRRYRYIYAIEQFKKYHADEQWIALATDVFENGNDKYFKELKNQCVFNGFGLLTVDANLDPKIIITPSRQDIFLGKRRRVDFLPQGKVRDIVKGSKFGMWWGIFGNKLPAFLKPDTSTLRFRRTFYNQMLITAISVVLIGVVFSKELQNPDFRELEQSTYRDKIARSKSNNLPEQEEVIEEPAAAFQPPKKAKKEDFWQLEKEEEATPSPALREAEPPADQPESVNGGEVFVSKGGSEFLIYDCARFYNFEGKKYIIQEGAYHSWELTGKQLGLLNKHGFEPSALPKSCFSKNASGFIIFLGMIYNSEEEAQKQLDKWRKSGNKVAGDTSRWQIRAIEAPEG